jgi:hypothetical protein
MDFGRDTAARRLVLYATFACMDQDSNRPFTRIVLMFAIEQKLIHEPITLILLDPQAWTKAVVSLAGRHHHAGFDLDRVRNERSSAARRQHATNLGNGHADRLRFKA